MNTTNEKLTLQDIADLRAYEREREEFRNRIIALKKRRRVHVGPVVTLLFENRDTIRFQIQEMARAERMLSDEQIQGELDVYNPLIPEPGELAATLFIELTTEDELREWLPGLVGIERSVEFRIGEGPEVETVPCRVDPDHEALLTREEVTASVHYVHFEFTEGQVQKFATEPVTLAVTLANYPEQASLSEETRQSLLGDIRGKSANGLDVTGTER
jgi:hypothetical protein